MTSLDGRVAIITGAGRGIGREHALLFADEGAKVVVNDLGGANDGEGSDQTPAEEVAAEIRARGGEAIANADNVADWEGAQHLVNSAIEAFGDLDIVVNNAGILRDKSFHNMDAELFDPVIDVHLRGAFNVTQPAWKVMREQGYGRIVSTSSAAGIFGNFGQANYGAAKMGLVGFTNVLAVEGAKYDIKANAIAPLAKTRMTEDLLGGLGDKLNPELVSPLVTYLAHESCEPTGRVFSVGGGRVAEVFIAETVGYANTTDLTPEDLAANWATVTDREGYSVPSQIAEETALFLSALS